VELAAGVGEETPEVAKPLAVTQRDHQAPVANRPVLAVAAEEVGLFDRRAPDGFGAGAVAQDREDPGGPRHAGQLDVAALTETDARADDEVANRARDQDLSGGGQLDDAGPHVDGDAVHVGLDQLALAGVHPDSPFGSDASTMPRAHRMARAGPSNTARTPLPSCLTSSPPKRVRWVLTSRSWAASTSRQTSSPRSTALGVDAAVSVKTRVSSRRCRGIGVRDPT
jgi:hypothetical protein